MRVVRFLLLLTGVAAVSGCAQLAPNSMAYPPAGASYPPAAAAYPPAGASYPAAGIDHVVYGTGGPYVPAPPVAAAAAIPPASSAPVPGALRPQAAPASSVATAHAPSVPAPVRVASAGDAVPLPATASPSPPNPAEAPARVAFTGPPLAAPAAVAVPAPTAYVPVVAAPEYTLDSGDRLRVVVFGQEGLTNAYLVDAAGLIDMPLIGQVMARGATTIDLAHRIAAKLRNGFIREPHVAVEVVAYRPFFILGEVTAPGQYPYVPRMTAETAVAIAGGYTPRAFRRNLILDRPEGGRIVRMSVPPSFPLHPGDTVNVQERWF
jgi:polysaccharide biosynthesis/export protein